QIPNGSSISHQPCLPARQPKSKGSSNIPPRRSLTSVRKAFLASSVKKSIWVRVPFSSFAKTKKRLASTSELWEANQESAIHGQAGAFLKILLSNHNCLRAFAQPLTQPYSGNRSRPIGSAWTQSSCLGPLKPRSFCVGNMPLSVPLELQQQRKR